MNNPLPRQILRAFPRVVAVVLLAVMAAVLHFGVPAAGRPSVSSVDRGAVSAADGPDARTDAVARRNRSSASAAPTATPSPAAVPPDVPGRVPAVAERAYRLAAAASGSCRLDWSLLAGIGKVETDHGRVFGGTIDAAGVATPAITGPPTEFGPAAGPMQILGSTWVKWAADGNGDGRDDVQNVYDAAAGAAGYLCDSGTRLTNLAAQQAAVFSYNHLDTYVFDVLAYAAAYAAGTPDFDVATVPILTPPTVPVTTTAPAPAPAAPTTAAVVPPVATVPAAGPVPAPTSAPATPGPSPSASSSASPTQSSSSGQPGSTGASPSLQR